MATTLAQRKEATTRRLEAALAALARGRSRDRTPEALVERAFSTALSTPAKHEPALLHRLWELSRERRSAKAQQHLHRLLRVVALRLPRLLEAEPSYQQNYLTALSLLAEQHRSWVREPEGFRPEHRNLERGFGELARHLLAQYSLPAFLDNLFLRPRTQTPAEWFGYLGKGGSPVHLPELTIPLTRHMGHHFMHPPTGVSVLQALRYGQVRGLGGSERLAQAVFNTYLGTHLGNRRQEVWRHTLFLWLAQQEEMDQDTLSMLLEYLESRQADDASFMMARRSLAVLLREAENWRGWAPPKAIEPDRRFEPSGFPGGAWVLGEGVDCAGWSVAEILDMPALRREGRAMQHCVATYAQQIVDGECAIWSLQRDGVQATKRAVTIQVDRANRSIVQVRGKGNRNPTRVEKAVIERWAAEASLKVDYYDQGDL
jgi:hypothetical protein